MEFRKTSIKYIITVTILGVLSLVMFFGFQNNVSEDANKDNQKDTIELTFSSSWGGMDTKSLALEDFLGEFEKENPGIKIVNRSKGNDDFLFTLKTDFAQGNEPDVFGLWPGSDLDTLIQVGKVADLTEALNEDETWKESIKEDTWRYDTSNGKIYGIPMEIIYEGLFVNKDVLDTYRLKIPKTFEELKDVVKSLKYYNIDTPIAFNCTPEGSYLYQNMVMKLGGKEDSENPYKNGNINSCYIKAMDYLKELYDIGAFSKDVFTMDDKARNEKFINKEAAMIVQGSWFIGEVSVKRNDNYVEIVPFPSFTAGKADDSSLIYGLGNGNFHISEKVYKDSKKRQAALKLLKYLTSKEAGEKLVNTTGSISSIKGINRNPKDILAIKGDDLINNSKELVGPIDSFMKRSSWENILVKKMPAMLTGEITPEEIFKEMEENK
ncbi:extracellular solute-binding protein [Clostridium sp. 19966]|uniref:ABC transporter substrate-binding protein n=1 Tax=Clostridium sp. 19966 TaxID=2768166 RepID=UPI0028E03AF5|nr:extracellular solute-binding protein [Clostridium sp. 19966]MDT8715527.1 extracellular solute-binding protein [Clostridium sp. 19966]